MTVITPSLDERWVAALAEIAQRGVRVSAVLIEPGTFGLAPSPLLTVSALQRPGSQRISSNTGNNASAFASPPSTLSRGARGWPGPTHLRRAAPALVRAGRPA